MLYRIQDGSVSLKGETILSHFDFEIKGNEKIGIVGKNGAGKTTLLRLIAGEISLDRDDKRKNKGIETFGNYTVGMLSQNAFSLEEAESLTVIEEFRRHIRKDNFLFAEKSLNFAVDNLKDSDEYLRYEFEYDTLFTKFGFSKEDKYKKISEFSGGQKKRIAFISLIMQKPDILLLDEPENHLDEDMISFLEDWVCKYEKAVVMVSHDRYFLDITTDIICEVENKKVKKYSGNYSAYVEQKIKYQNSLIKEIKKREDSIEKLDELIKKFGNRQKKAKFVRSKEILLKELSRIEKPLDIYLRPDFGEIIPDKISSRCVLEAEKLQIGYDKAICKIDFRLKRGQKIGVIGPNGIGKTTFLKTAAGIIPGLSGKCIIGQGVDMQYLDQETAVIDKKCSVLEYYQKVFPNMTNKDVRAGLARFLFTGKDVMKSVDKLSGGEKMRFAFALIFENKPNFLVLDEPTNHMDIQTMETLESALCSYKGTLLFISHDRYFISRVAESLLVFEENGVKYYPVDYKHYVKQQKQKKLYGDNASLIEGEKLLTEFQNVPEAEKGRFRTISTEQAYIEWKIKRILEDIEVLDQNLIDVECKKEKAEYKDWLESFGYIGQSENNDVLETYDIEIKEIEDKIVEFLIEIHELCED